jgi:RNA recognition motif-containing protein
MGRWLNIEESNGAPVRDGNNNNNDSAGGDTVFVGNLSFNVTEDELREVFE